jgi:hypothetical protein
MRTKGSLKHVEKFFKSENFVYSGIAETFTIALLF